MDWLQSHIRLFRAMLHCYPAEFRHEYGAEMEQLFADRLRAEPHWRLWLETMADAAASAPREHLAILAADFKHEVRALAKMPGFTMIVLLVMALGIGSTVSVFSVVDAVLLRSLPYGDPQELVYIWSPNVNFKGTPNELGVNAPDFFEWQRSSRSFASMTALLEKSMNVVSHGYARRVSAAFVTASFFNTLECHTALGRPLRSEDEHAAVISDDFWRAALDGSGEVLGSQIQLDREKYTVVGVMPKGFGYPFDGDIPYYGTEFGHTQLWLPATYTAAQKSDRKLRAGAIVIGRLKHGVSLAAAETELRGIESRLQTLYEPVWRGRSVLLKPLVTTILGPVQEMMWILLGVVGLVLAIAICNVTGLLLARVSARAHELGIRTALGAERARIVRQLLTESILLSCAGGLLGSALAYALVRMLVALNPGGIPRFDLASVDSRALATATLLSIGAGVLAGFVPAMTAAKASSILKSGGARVGGGSHRSHFALILLEVALSMVLLTAAGLLIRSYMLLEAVDPGFSPATLAFSVELDERYKTPESQDAFYRELLGKLQSIPGFTSVGATDALPLEDEGLAWAEIKGFGRSLEMVEPRGVTPEYRKALGTPLLRGRDFDLHDEGTKAALVAIVNAKFAEIYFRGRDPLGGQIRIGPHDARNTRWSTVVGIIGDIHHNGLEQAAKPQIFQPADSGNNFAIRTDLSSQSAAAEVRAVLRAMDSALRPEIKTMGERVKRSNARRTFQTSLLTGFAVSAMALALAGLYGLMSYAVKQRTTEIGIRLAIGSPRGQVLGLIVWQGLRLTAIGLVIGVAAAFGLTRFVSAWLFGVEALDPLTFVATPLFIFGVAASACLVPAWGATKIDPILALRQE